MPLEHMRQPTGVLGGSYHVLAPLGITSKDKGFAHPFVDVDAFVAITHAGRYMASVKLSWLDLFPADTAAKHCLATSWSSISHIFNSLFSGDARGPPLPIPCYVAGGTASHKSDDNKKLQPDGVLVPAGCYNLLYASILAIFVNASAANKTRWVASSRTVIAVLMGPSSRLSQLQVDMSCNNDLVNLNKGLEMSGMDQSRTVNATRQLLMSQGANKEHSAELLVKTLSNHGFSSLRLVRACLRVHEHLLSVPGVKDAMMKIEMYHGKHALACSVYKLEALVHACLVAHRSHLPIVLAHLHFMLGHNAVKTSGASIQFLKGRTGNANGTEDIGLFQRLLLRHLLVLHLVDMFAPQMPDALINLFNNINVYARSFPSPREQAAGAQPDNQWLTSLSHGCVKFEDLACSLYDGHSDSLLKDAWRTAKTFDPSAIITASTGLSEPIDAIKHEFDGAQDDAEVPSAAGLGVITVAERTDDCSPTKRCRTLTSDDDDVDDDLATGDSENAESKTTVKAKAAGIRSEYVALVVVPYASGQKLFTDAVEPHSVFKHFAGAWGKSHRFLVLDSRHLMESPAKPWRKPPQFKLQKDN